MRKIAIILLCMFAVHFLYGGEAAEIVTVDGLSFVNTLLLPGSEAIDDSQHYLKTALDNMGLDLPNTTVTAFHWSRDAADTSETVETLRTFLIQKYKAAKQAGKRFIIVAHSWGTVLTYLALSSQSTQADSENRVYVDLYITLGSPLGVNYAHSGTKYPEETLVINYTGNWLNQYSFCETCLPLATRWINYWAWGDAISGPFFNGTATQDGFINNSGNSEWEDVKIDAGSVYGGYFTRNTTTTVIWHMYDSLQPGGLVNNQPLLDTVKQEIEHDDGNGSGIDNPPFGSFDLPAEGSSNSGSIAVTGWALDDISIENVKIYRNASAGEAPGMVFIDTATFIEGARPDVQQAFPGYPNASSAGWGYMLLTHFLPGGGNGEYTLYAVVTDSGGQSVSLGSKTITCDNANAVKPFGAIDSPDQGETVSGNQYVNWGWALTPQPNKIPVDGSTISVWINGKNAGHPVYNEFRNDIATYFPGYANSQGASGYFYIDTAAYENGVYTIQWTVTDNAGNTDGIGSRYFTIQNNPERGSRLNRTQPPAAFAKLSPNKNLNKTVRLRTGYRCDTPLQEFVPTDNGCFNIEINNRERLEIHFGEPVISGSPLPAGSQLDARRGIFYWQPGPAFLGRYQLIFIDNQGMRVKKVSVSITN